jgi:hypothetical protein
MLLSEQKKHIRKAFGNDLHNGSVVGNDVLSVLPKARSTKKSK